MDSLPIGSHKKLEIRTDKAVFVIKSVYTKNDEKCRICENISSVTVKAENLCFAEIAGKYVFPDSFSVDNGKYVLKVPPLLFEDTDYEIIVKSITGEEIALQHESRVISDGISRVSQDEPGILSGIVNFGTHIGLSDFVISVWGKIHAVITIEVFPSRISYKEDFRNMISDILHSVYGASVSLMEKTRSDYGAGPSREYVPEVFFGIIKQVFGEYIKAARNIAQSPYHTLKKEHTLVPVRLAREFDGKTEKWLSENGDASDKILAVKSGVSFDTPENRFVKASLVTTEKRLSDLKARYILSESQPDGRVLSEINGMINTVKSVCTHSFLSSVPPSKQCENAFAASGKPRCRAFLKYHSLLSKGISADGEIFRISSKETSLLYEYWCFIKLSEMLKYSEWTEENGINRYRLVSPDVIKADKSGVTVSLAKGKTSELHFLCAATGKRISLVYEGDGLIHLTVFYPDMSIRERVVFLSSYALEQFPDKAYPDTSPGPRLYDLGKLREYLTKKEATEGSGDCRVVGAYVLFPYSDTEKYISHVFYPKDAHGGVYGVPFLPGHGELVQKLIADIICKSTSRFFDSLVLDNDLEQELAKTHWDTFDVLVGSLRSDAQYKLNFEKRFYHTPAVNIPQGKNIGYIALCRQRSLGDPGIFYYGKVIKTKLMPRGKVPAPMSRNNADEPYFVFGIKEWIKLEKPIEIKEEGVYAPKFTDLFLLTHSAFSYELFSIRSEMQFRLHAFMLPASGKNVGDADDERVFRVSDGIALWQRKGAFEFCSTSGKLLLRIKADEYAKHSGYFIKQIAKITGC